MQHGKTSPKAYELLDEMRASVEALHPTKDAKTVLYDNLLQRLHELGDARRARLLQAEEGVAILWAVLLVGDNGGLHHFLRAAQHDGALTDGRRARPRHRAGALHRGRPRLPVQGRMVHRPRRLRAGTGRVREQRAKRPPVGLKLLFSQLLRREILGSSR